MIGYIYKVVNSVNDKVYIGKTNNLRSRWNGHKSSVNNNRSNSKLPLAMKKYGFDKFHIVPILVVLDYENNANYFEKLLIEEYDSYRSGYNSTRGGESSPLGSRKRTEVVGNRYGSWVVVSDLPDIDFGHYQRRMVLCRCDCGNISEVGLTNIASGKSLSCGCSRPKGKDHYTYVDRIGQRFGALTMIGQPFKDKYKKCRCLCDCGRTKDVLVSPLLRGLITSCGCMINKVKRVSVCGVVYASYRDAAKQLNVNEKTVRRWMKSKPNEVFYLDNPPQPEV